MTFKKIFYLSSLIAFPAACIIMYALKMYPIGYNIRLMIPNFTLTSTLVAVIILEQVYVYKKSTSQKHVLIRDIFSTVINGFYASSIIRPLVFPIIMYLPNVIMGREVIFTESQNLGPVWLQFFMVLFFYSFLRYSTHRLQHTIPFLWELHSYHHGVTDIRASNLLVSHPLDYFIRNSLPPIILGLIGFNFEAVIYAVGILGTMSVFSHCGSGARAGRLLNLVFMTPEVHRWHHSTVTPEGHKYAVNYGVGFNVWDRIFGTFYLPHKDGIPEQPDEMGHPEGLQDEKNYLKILFLIRYWPKFMKPWAKPK